jgi:hypothetical protein
MIHEASEGQALAADHIGGSIMTARKTVTRTLTVDGVRFVLADLGVKENQELEKALKPFLTREATKTVGNAGKAPTIRAWAQENGVKVGARGRVAPDVIAAFEAAQSK